MIGLTDENILANTIQSIKDLIYGGLTQRNMKSIRTCFAVNAMDSLDSDYPMYVPFNIPANTVKVVTVYVSFTILPFRAYSKSAASSEQITTSSGGGATTSSGGGATVTSHAAYERGFPLATRIKSYIPHEDGYLIGDSGYGGPDAHGFSVTTPGHIHTVAIPSHYHYVYPHTHTIPPHAHEINFGIYEVDKHPSITLYVSRDGGGTYPYRIGTYSSSQNLIEITQYVDTPGNKMLKFEATDLGRVSTQIEIKVDISK